MALGGGSMAQRNEGMAPRHAKKRLGRTLTCTLTGMTARTCTSTHKHTRLHTYKHTNIQTYKHTYPNTQATLKLCVPVRVSVYPNTHVTLKVCVRVRVSVRVCACVRARVRACVCMWYDVCGPTNVNRGRKYN